MTETVGNVKLNLDFYKGTDTYSDGDIEDELLRMVRSGNEYIEYLANDSRWPVLYHLSPIRENLLNWYEFNGGSLLEIGAGCGAVSGVFCRNCDRVVGVDLSKRRSMINAYRHKDCGNLELIVGNFEDMRFREQFDYVTLIGVLEYSIYYIASEQPFLDMLKKTKALLKDNGTLIIAIENKYGLKYWSGAREDHTGEVFDGITGYPASDRVRTFSRNALEELIREAGYKKTEFYYPMPDYKLPMEIYSDGYLPRDGDIHQDTPAYDRDRFQLFHENAVFDALCKDGMFPVFANSFLVFCR